MGQLGAEVLVLVHEQLAHFGDVERRKAFERLLCEPTLESRAWDWNDNRAVEVCIFARSPEHGIVFAYAKEGYGDPWGALYDTESTLGMDAQWYAYLEDAFISCGAWEGPVPPGFEIR